MYEFGLGTAWARFTDGTSAELGTLQNISFDFSWDSKELYGRKQFPVYVARGKGKVEGKAGFADMKAKTLNAFLNGTLGTGQLVVAEPVTTTIPSATPYTITITAPTGGTLNSLLGVYNVSGTDKIPMTLVTGTPTTGEYAYDAGVITFASADEGVAIQYQYDYTLTTGNNVALTNQMMGTVPVFELEMYQTLAGIPLTIVLFKCVPTKLNLDMKQEDYTIPDFSFSAFANAADQIGNIYLSE